MRINKAEDRAQDSGAVQDITELYLDFKEKYRNVFIQKIEDQVFIYRTLGRNEYKNILKDDRFDDFGKEELICQVCTLYPENFDYENCDAGWPTVLKDAILKNSLLDSVVSRKRMLDYYREEMFDLDNQITCIINEAFPDKDLEEIADFDVEKTTFFLSRAEWKLHNLRGLKFHDNDSVESFYDQVKTEPEVKEVKQDKSNVSKTTIRGGSRNEKLTPEKIKEMEEFNRKFPEFNIKNDGGFQGVDGLAQDSIDITSPALRPGA